MRHSAKKPPPGKTARGFFLFGLALIPLAYLSDCALDALLFGEATFREQLLSPSAREVSIRVLFSIFMLALILVGRFLLALLSERERKVRQQLSAVEQVNRELGEVTLALTGNLRGLMTQLATQISLIEEQSRGVVGHDRLQFLVDEACRKSALLEDLLDELHQRADNQTRNSPRILP